MEVIESIVDGFNAIINILKMGFNTLMNFFKSLGLVLEYIGNAVIKAMDIADTLPSWIKGFVLMTIAISTIYIIVGRAGGKSE